ncbi:MAG: transposase [bacterium]
MKRIIAVIHGIRTPTRFFIWSGSGKIQRVEFKDDGLEVPRGERETAEGKQLKWLLTEFRPGDLAVFMMGGSGDHLAYAFARRAAELNGDTSVVSLPSFWLKRERNIQGWKKEKDGELLIELARTKPELFRSITIPQQHVLRIRGQMRRYELATELLAKCKQRMKRLLVGRLFYCEEGKYPEGRIADWFLEEEANDETLTTLERNKRRVTQELEYDLEQLGVYSIFQKVVGVGPGIAGRLIAAILDINRFSNADKLVAYCGVHVVGNDPNGVGGRFPQRRRGEVANWDDRARKALFLFVDQCIRRQKSPWGQKFLELKAQILLKHPNPIKDEKSGKTKWTKGHIHATTRWKLATLFVRYIYREWKRLEREGLAGVVELPAKRAYQKRGAAA